MWPYFLVIQSHLPGAFDIIDNELTLACLFEIARGKSAIESDYFCHYGFIIYVVVVGSVLGFTAS